MDVSASRQFAFISEIREADSAKFTKFWSLGGRQQC